MINDEFLVKIETIIAYLEKNGGYNYKLYNHTCPTFYNDPDSNIVEYAKDIRDYWKDLTCNENLETYIKMEICQIIIDNLKLFSLDDSKLTLLKEYCKTKTNEPINPTSNEVLMKLVHEALIDLLSAKTLYDFRNIE